MKKTFPTPDPISLYVEMGAGSATVRSCDDLTVTTVQVEGHDADKTEVEQWGDQIIVMAPQRRTGFFGSSGDELDITVQVPAGSSLVTKMASADLVATGRYSTARIKSASGDVEVEEVRSDAVLETGSGNIELRTAHADLRIKTGSGDVQVGTVTGSVVVTSASGDIAIEATEGEAVLKTASGDVAVGKASSNLAANSASGDIRIGSVAAGVIQAKGVSGDLRIGVPPAIPVWTDVSCLSGRVTSTLEGAGQPLDGQPYLEIRAKTVSGDIDLVQL